MKCPVCKGTGVPEVPHVPSVSGGWLDKKVTWVPSRCGACNGTGRVHHGGADGRCTPTDEKRDSPRWSRADTERLVASVAARLHGPVESFCDVLQKQFRFGPYREGSPGDDPKLNRHRSHVEGMKVELLKDIHLCDDVPDRLRAEMAVLVSRIKATSTYECRQAMDYFGSNKPPSGATLIELGLDRLYQAIWDREKQVRLGLW